MKIFRCYPASCTGQRDGTAVPAFTNRGSVPSGNSPLARTLTSSSPPLPLRLLTLTLNPHPHPANPHPHPVHQVTRGNVGQLSPATVEGLLGPYDLPGSHDHNLNLYRDSFGSTDERERRALPPNPGRTLALTLALASSSSSPSPSPSP